VAAQAKPSARSQPDSYETVSSQYGSLKVLQGVADGKLVKVPVAVIAPDNAASVDLQLKVPTIRIGKGATADPILLTPNGVTLKKGAAEQKWSKAVVKELLDAIVKSPERTAAALALRTACHLTIPEYAYRSKSAPGWAPLAKQVAKNNASMAKSTHGPRNQICTTETVTTMVETTVTKVVEKVLTALQQLRQCHDHCASQYGPQKPLEWAGCELACAGKSFVDVMVGTVEVVETVVEAVVTQITTCVWQAIPKGQFPNPFDGWRNLEVPGFFAGAAPVPEINGAAIADALGLLKGLLNLGPLVSCLLEGQWSFAKLENVGVNVPGIASVPFGVTVCLDTACTDKLLTLGITDAFGLMTSLIGKVGSLPAAIAALGTGAAAAIAGQAATAIMVVLIVLMAHLVAIAAQVGAYKLFGLAPNGVCLTHPSLPIAAVGVLNPVLGILAVANIPLLVTPA